MNDKFINEITHGDSLNLLRKVPDDSIDVTFADPPFNLKKKYKSYNDSCELQEYLEWCKEWIAEMARITKPSGAIFLHNIPKWLTYYAGYLNMYAHFKHWIAWDAPTSPMGKSLQPAHYGILFYAKEPKKIKFFEIRHPHKRDRKTGWLQKDYGGKKDGLHPFGPLVSDVWTEVHRIKHNKFRDEHPCQLPVPLLERLILMTTDEGDIILDPFSGTGTTAIAAKRLGRNFIGFEIDESYVTLSQKKLEKTFPVSKIGNIWVSFYLDEVVTIRDIDWKELSQYYKVPEPIRNIDHTKIILKEGITKPAKTNLRISKEDIVEENQLKIFYNFK